jgi:MFS transporter, PAT family, beta-lactamase induction signal transducer AmpG
VRRTRMSPQATKTPRSPWVFVPSLYFLQGVPYFVVDTATTVFFQRIGVPIETIGRISSLITLPWMLKPLWSPLVDTTASKRAWTVAMQFAVVCGIALLALATTQSNAVMWCTIACAWIALASATHDVACDGYYLLALDAPNQAAFVGVRSACYRLARVFVTGGVVYLAGAFQEASASGSTSWLALGAAPTHAWQYAFACAAGVYALGFVWGSVAMPRAARDVSAQRKNTATRGQTPPFLEALASYFAKPRIFGIVAFILLYRFGESMLTKMSGPFLLSSIEKGGMALTEKQVGIYSGTVGVAALIVGGIAGGALISKYGARRCLWPMVIAMHAPNVLYAWAAFAHPGHAALAVVIAIEQLGYGFGFAAYMVVLMIVSRDERFATTHYALSTGLMALGALAAGFVSGSLVAAVGFAWFFVCVCLAGIPGMITLFFVPLERE